MNDHGIGARGPFQLGRTGTDQRVDDRVEGGEPFGVGEDDRAELRPVQGSVRGQDPGAERLYESGVPGSPGLDDLARDPVGVDEDGSVADEQP